MIEFVIHMWLLSGLIYFDFITVKNPRQTKALPFVSYLFNMMCCAFLWPLVMYINHQLLKESQNGKRK